MRERRGSARRSRRAGMQPGPCPCQQHHPDSYRWDQSCDMTRRIVGRLANEGSPGAAMGKSVVMVVMMMMQKQCDADFFGWGDFRQVPAVAKPPDAR